MTGLLAAFSALALASTASVADSEIAEMRAETLVGMRTMLAGGRPPIPPATGGTIRPPRPPGDRRFDGGTVQTYTAWTGSPAAGRGSMPWMHRAVAQLARVPVSKTGGWGFESLLPCECD